MAKTHLSLDPGDDHRDATCLACGAHAHLPHCPAVDEHGTDLLIEHLDTGTVRTWMLSGIRHNLTAARRHRFAAQMPHMRWVRPVDEPKLPMSTGWLINNVITEMGVGARLAAIGWHGLAAVPIPDCACTDRWRCRCDFESHPFRFAHPDLWPEHAVFALKLRYHRGWSLIWMADTGLGAVWVAEDFTPALLPPGPVTRRCWLAWCDTCPASIGHRAHPGAPACACPCHTATEEKEIPNGNVKPPR